MKNKWLDNYNKPLFRWIIGPCTKLGLQIHRESVRRALSIYGDQFEWKICVNNQTQEGMSYLRDTISGTSVQLVDQSWADCPIPVKRQQLSESEDGNYPLHGNNCNGSLWKYCPGRMKMHTHEIIADNDLIITKPLDMVDLFLRDDELSCVLEDRYRYYGDYDHKIPNLKLLNSGLICLPPNYDFGKRVANKWYVYGEKKSLTQADEQGLTTNVLVNDFGRDLRCCYKEDVIQTLGQENTIGSYVTDVGLSYDSSDVGVEEEYFLENYRTAKAFHFCQANKLNEHIGWSLYKKKIGLIKF